MITVKDLYDGHIIRTFPKEDLFNRKKIKFQTLDNGLVTPTDL